MLFKYFSIKSYSYLNACLQCPNYSIIVVTLWKAKQILSILVISTKKYRVKISQKMMRFLCSFFIMDRQKIEGFTRKWDFKWEKCFNDLIWSILLLHLMSHLTLSRLYTHKMLHYSRPNDKQRFFSRQLNSLGSPINFFQLSLRRNYLNMFLEMHLRKLGREIIFVRTGDVRTIRKKDYLKNLSFLFNFFYIYIFFISLSFFLCSANAKCRRTDVLNCNIALQLQQLTFATSLLESLRSFGESEEVFAHVVSSGSSLVPPWIRMFKWKLFFPLNIRARTWTPNSQYSLILFLWKRPCFQRTFSIKNNCS